jgi:Ca2+-binding EF-hand superfamily protein
MRPHPEHHHVKQSNLLVLAIASVLTAGVAIAAPATAPKAPAAHARIDANGDGVIDRTEAAARPRFAEMFDRLDKNHDGRIDASERPQHGMRDGMRHGGFAKLDANNDGAIDRAEAAKIPGFAQKFDQLDKNKDGRIDASERPQHGMRDGKGGRMARLDADHDGRLSRAEAAKSPMAQRFEQLDANHDGFVDRDEARAAFKRMREQRANGVGSGGTG